MSSSRILFYFCLSFIGGVFINSFFNVSFQVFFTFLILTFILILISLKKKKITVFAFCFLFVAFGIWRYQITEFEIRNNDILKYNESGEKINLIAKVVKEPDIRENNIKLTVKPEGEKGKILIITRRYPEYQYGDKLKIRGEMLTPPVFESFNYRDYLLKEGIYSVMYWPKIELLNRNEGNKFYSKLLFLKNKLREAVYQNLSPPQSAILGAMILGDKNRISQEWKEKLNRAGVRHLTAISGMHITILSTLLMTLLISLGFWRQQAFYFSIILITLFILMTGLQPSAIRAGIMGALFLLSQYLGRMINSFRIIFFAAALMLFQNPLLLRFDVGFQLSFLAILGITSLSPLFQEWFKKIPNCFQLRDVLKVTLSAQVFTLPLLIYNFGYVSLVSPLTNILIVPLLPLILALGFLSALMGIFFSWGGWVLSWPVWFLLTYIIKIVDFFSSLSFAWRSLKISWLWLVVFYLILGLGTWYFQKKQKLKFLQY